MPSASVPAIRRNDVDLTGGWLSPVLSRPGTEATDLNQRPAKVIPALHPFDRRTPGQHLLLTGIGSDEPSRAIHPMAVSSRRSATRSAPRSAVLREQGEQEIRYAYVTGSITRSLFEDAQEVGLSEPLVVSLAEIFGWDIDFALDLRRGDRFAVIHEERYWLGRKLADGEILAAEFVNRGKTYRAIAYRHEDGTLSYYTPAGKSLRRVFLRAPVKLSRVSSAFSEKRYHPILRTWRAHKGIDYAAAIGTPVHATASAGSSRSAGTAAMAKPSFSGTGTLTGRCTRICRAFERI